MRFLCLDSFRGVAMLLLVAFHVLEEQTYGPAVAAIVGNGYKSIQIFFIISGYGVSVAISKVLRGDISPLSFLRKRMARIFVPYWFSLFFAAVVFPAMIRLGVVLKGNTAPPNFPGYSLSDWLRTLTLTNVFFADSWENLYQQFPLNEVAWFIAIIVQMYAVLTAAALRPALYYHCLIAVTCVWLASLVPCLGNLVPFGLFLPFWPNFALGIMLFLLMEHGFALSPRIVEKKKIAYCLLTVGVALTALVLFFTQFGNLFAVVMAALFWTIYPNDKNLSRSRLCRFFVAIGTFSYSLFLLHIPLIRLTEVITKNIPAWPPQIVTLFGVLPFILLFSFVWHLFFEKPASAVGSAKVLLHPLATLKNGLSSIGVRLPD